MLPACLHPHAHTGCGWCLAGAWPGMPAVLLLMLLPCCTKKHYFVPGPRASYNSYCTGLHNFMGPSSWAFHSRARVRKRLAAAMDGDIALPISITGQKWKEVHDMVRSPQSVRKAACGLTLAA